MAQLANWLGPARAKLLVGLFAIALVVSLGLVAVYGPEPWVISVQLALAWVCLFAVALALHVRAAPRDRRRLWLALGPGLILLAIGVAWPGGVLFLAGVGAGWIVVAQFVLRSRVRMEYKAAIKHLRNSAYDDGLPPVMDRLIEAEPDDLNHRRFRAEIYRLAGGWTGQSPIMKAIVARDPGLAGGAGWAGGDVCSERRLRDGAALRPQAHERDPGQWMGAYNWG